MEYENEGYQNTCDRNLRGQPFNSENIIHHNRSLPVVIYFYSNRIHALICIHSKDREQRANANDERQSIYVLSMMVNTAGSNITRQSSGQFVQSIQIIVYLYLYYCPSISLIQFTYIYIILTCIFIIVCLYYLYSLTNIIIQSWN